MTEHVSSHYQHASSTRKSQLRNTARRRRHFILVCPAIDGRLPAKHASRHLTSLPFGVFVHAFLLFVLSPLCICCVLAVRQSQICLRCLYFLHNLCFVLISLYSVRFVLEFCWMCVLFCLCLSSFPFPWACGMCVYSHYLNHYCWSWCRCCAFSESCLLSPRIFSLARCVCIYASTVAVFLLIFILFCVPPHWLHDGISNERWLLRYRALRFSISSSSIIATTISIDIAASPLIIPFIVQKMSVARVRATRIQIVWCFPLCSSLISIRVNGILWYTMVCARACIAVARTWYLPIKLLLFT